MINPMKKMIQIESVEDVLTILALSKPLPDIDSIYTRYRFEVVADRTLFKVLEQLIQQGVLIDNGTGLMKKGPNWALPSFVKERKYST